MRVIVTAENRFARTPDGAVWTPVQYGRRFWNRYLEVFDGVDVVGRVRNVGEIPYGWHRVDGDGVAVRELPYYEGPWQYLWRLRDFHKAVKSEVASSEALIFRVSSEIARIAQPDLTKLQRPYAVEVISDPHGIFAPGAFQHPLRPFLRWWLSRALRSICSHADAAAYVTEHTLQQNYPPGQRAYATHYSDVDLSESAFAKAPKVRTIDQASLNLICVGSLAQLYKSPDVVLTALARCAAEGLDVHLTWVGDGQFLQRMQALAQELEIAHRVDFRGALPPGSSVREELDKADIFLLVSRHESLPRALIEAMARGLPCIGSAVGGIPELLRADALVPPGDVGALVELISSMSSDPGRMNAMAARNLDKSREFMADALAARQIEFLRNVRDQTEAWQVKWSRRKSGGS
jgi:glycosyltransferase involved in cell wall biosynthesis